MLTKNAFTFLKRQSRFQFLGDDALRKLVSHLGLKFYPAGTLILKEHGPPTEFLHIIKQGGVMVYTQSASGEKDIIDYRGEGDTFGVESVTGKDRQDTSVEVVDDLEAYLLKGSDLRKLLEEEPSLADVLREAPSPLYRNPTYGEIVKKSLLYGESEKLLFTAPVRDLATRRVVIASREISIGEAARRMSSKRVDSLVLTGEDELPLGIVTDQDLRDKGLCGRPHPYRLHPPIRQRSGRSGIDERTTPPAAGGCGTM